MINIIVFFDCGDTLVDESTQFFEDKAVKQAELIPGTLETLSILRKRGHRIAMVADGYTASFQNLFRQHDIAKFFDVIVISEEVGRTKPDPRMFLTAMERMGLVPQDVSRIVMIGNNLACDITGANKLGIYSVLLTYSPRYNMTPSTELEKPDARTASLGELPALIEQLESRFTRLGHIK